MFDIIWLHMLYSWSLPIGKQLLHHAPPCFAAGSRLFLGGLMLLVYAACTKKKHAAWFERKHIMLYARIAFIGVYLKYILRYWALSQMSSAQMALLLTISPCIAACISYVWCNERLTRSQWLSIAMVSYGGLPILFARYETQSIFNSWFAFLPTVATIVAIIAHFYGLMLARTLICQHGYSTTTTNGIRMFGGGLFALLTAFAYEGFFPVSNVTTFSIWLVLLLFISNIICHNQYLALLKRYSITFLALTDYLMHFFTACYGWAFLHEAISWHYGVAGIFVFSGLYMFWHEENRRSLRPKKIYAMVAPDS